MINCDPQACDFVCVCSVLMTPPLIGIRYVCPMILYALVRALEVSTKGHMRGLRGC